MTEHGKAADPALQHTHTCPHSARGGEWLVDGRRAARVMGVLVAALGCVLIVLGLTLTKMGHTGLQRYKRVTGRIALVLSPSDERYYGQLAQARAIGVALAALGATAAGAGVLVLVSPRVTVGVLGSGQQCDSSVQAESSSVAGGPESSLSSHP